MCAVVQHRRQSFGALRLVAAVGVLLLAPSMASAFPVTRSMTIAVPIAGQPNVDVGTIDVTFSQTEAQSLAKEVTLHIVNNLNAGAFVAGSQGQLGLSFNYGANPGNQTLLNALSIVQTASNPATTATLRKGSVDSQQVNGPGGFFDFGFYWDGGNSNRFLPGGTVTFKITSTQALSVNDFFYTSAYKQGQSYDGDSIYLAAAHVQGLKEDIYGVNSVFIGAVVPEPSTFAVAGLSGLALLGYGLRRRKLSRA